MGYNAKEKSKHCLTVDSVTSGLRPKNGRHDLAGTVRGLSWLPFGETL